MTYPQPRGSGMSAGEGSVAELPTCKMIVRFCQGVLEPARGAAGGPVMMLLEVSALL